MKNATFYFGSTMINLAVIGEKLPYNSTIATEKKSKRGALDIISSPAEVARQILIRVL